MTGCFLTGVAAAAAGNSNRTLTCAFAGSGMFFA